MRLFYNFSTSSPSLRSTRLLFLLLLSTLFIYGCTAPEKAPVSEDSFFAKRAGDIRESGSAAYLDGDFMRALSLFREAYKIDSTTGAPGELVSDLIGIGQANAGLGRMAEAERYLTKSVHIAFTSRDESRLGDAYAALAGFYLENGNLRLATENIDDAIRLHGTGAGASAALLNLAGSIYLQSGSLDTAAGSVQEAITRAEAAGAGPSPVLGDSYRIMAEILAKQGRGGEAGLYFTRAYDVDTWLDNDRKRALDLSGYAGMLFSARRYAEAAAKLKDSYRLNMKSGFIDGAIRDIDKLVEVYIAMGDKKSESYYRTMREAVLSDIR